MGAGRFQFRPRHAAGILGAALLIATPFINLDEGERLTSYPDVGGVWTACHGVAYVLPHHTYTQEECDEMDAAAREKFGEGVVKLITAEISPYTLSAHIRFAYNIGLGAYKGSNALRLTNSGDIVGGCNAMMDFHRAGGLDCRVKANNCYGLINRRTSEIQQCVYGAQQ